MRTTWRRWRNEEAGLAQVRGVPEEGRQRCAEGDAMWLIPTSIFSRFAPARRCSMREFAALYPRRGLFVTSSGTALPRLFCWRGWRMRRWSRHLFGADALKISPRGSGAEPWIALLLASRASPGAPPESNKATPTSGGYGPPSPESSTPSAQASYSLRMCQGSLLDEESIAYSAILPASGSMRNGVLFPRATWEPPICEGEFSSWPSTRAEDAESCGNHPNGASDSLTGVTRTWPTATAGDCQGHSQYPHNPTLVGAADNFWQTPATDSFRSRGGDRVDEMGLDQQARLFWPTPCASDDNKSPRAHLAMKAAMPGGPRSQITSLQVLVQMW